MDKAITEEIAYLQDKKSPLYKELVLMQQNYQEFLANNGRECVLSDKNNRVANNKYLNEIEIETTKTNQTIFTYDNQIIDMEELASKNIDTLNSKLYFMGIELTGGTESPNPLSAYFFGELDSKSNIGLDESLPIYHFSPKDEENNLGTLLIFLNASTLTLLNYSLLDSTLNIKLELTNKESKEKQDKAIIQNKQKQHKEQLKPLSTAMLHPLLEDNEIKCMHNGAIKLKNICYNIGLVS